MTGLVALVLAARQAVGARHRAHVVEVDAALLVALVLAAAALLCATLLASGVVGTGRQIDAFHHLVHVAAAALDARLLVAWRTWAVVTFGCKKERVRVSQGNRIKRPTNGRDGGEDSRLTLTYMRMRRLAASQRLPAISRAQRNRVGARRALAFRQRHFSARTRLHRGRHQFAVVALVRVAQPLASMVAALQLLVAHFGARVLRRRVILLRARQ